MTMLVEAPAGYIPAVAVSFGGQDAAAQAVDADHPLPVQPAYRAAVASPLVGVSAGTDLVGPFQPDLGRPIWLTLSAGWSGSVTVMRSVDGGATRRAVTLAGTAIAFTGSMQEAIGEESVAGASWWLAIAATSGAVGYEVRQ